MAVLIHLPANVEQRLRAETADFDADIRETIALDLFRRGKLSHSELSEVLGFDRVMTDAFLQRHNVLEGSLTMHDLDEQAGVLERVLGSASR